jgi:hypothetical protein
MRTSDCCTLVSNIDLILIAGTAVPGTTPAPTTGATIAPTTIVPTLATPTSVPPTAAPTTTTGAASDLLFSPTSQAVTNGSTFPVEVRVNATNGQMVNAIQSQVNYPSNLLDVVSVTNSGGAFEVEAQKTIGVGSIDLAYGTTTPKTGNQLIATIVFQAKAFGNAVVSYNANSVVVSSTTNTNVLRNRISSTFSIPAPTPTPVPPTPTNTPTPRPTSTPTPVPPTPTNTPTPVPSKIGDINKDGFVNLTDLSIMLSNWNLTTSTGDLNGDGKVGITDLSILLTNWGL